MTYTQYQAGLDAAAVPAQRAAAGAIEAIEASSVAPVFVEAPANHRADMARLRAHLWGLHGLAAVGAALVAVVMGVWPIAVPVAAWLLVSSLIMSRRSRVCDLLSIGAEARLVGVFAIASTVACVVLGSVTAGRMALTLFAAIAAATTVARLVLKSPATQKRLGLRLRESVLLAGDRASVARTLSEWSDLDNLRVVGVCLRESEAAATTVDDFPVLGEMSEIAALSERLAVDVVAVHTNEELQGSQLARLQWALETSGAQLSLITPVTNTRVGRAHIRPTGDRLVVDLANCRPTGAVAWAKQAVDTLLGSVLLIIAAPVLLVCGALIKLESRGPVFFKQTRVRENGRTFTMLKLRTMVVDAEALREQLEEQNEVGGGLFKMKEDPRITRVGRLLRGLSLDELPQLINVVRGEMSLIGPRPALPSEVAGYDDRARRRLSVKPGLTGLWQVSGRSNLSWDESVCIDIDYVDNWSPAMDAKIAVSTVKAVVTRDGAH